MMAIRGKTERFGRILAAIAGLAGMILITAARVIGRLSDGVVLVVRTNLTSAMLHWRPSGDSLKTEHPSSEAR